jgi:hypothetical protein
MVLSESSLGLLPPAFVVLADNIQAQTDRFCLLDPVPTGSGPFFYRPGVKQRRAKTPAQAALLIGYDNPFMSLRSSAKADLNIRKHLDHLVLRNTAPGHVEDHPSDCNLVPLTSLDRAIHKP